MLSSPPAVAEMLRAGLMRTLSPPVCSNNSVLLSNKPTLRYRSTRASQKRRTSKEDPAPLQVSIKGLSELEENYVRRQTQLCLTGQPVPVQGRQEELNKLYKKAGVKVKSCKSLPFIRCRRSFGQDVHCRRGMQIYAAPPPSLAVLPWPTPSKLRTELLFWHSATSMLNPLLVGGDCYCN